MLAQCAFAVALRAGAQAPATSFSLQLPSAVAFDTNGNLYVAETGSHVIHKITTGGTLTTVAGNGIQGFAGDNGPAIAAEFDSPAGLALDPAGNLWIADTHNHRIRKVDAVTGIVSTVAGAGTPGFSGDGGAATAALLNLPTAITLDASGNVWVADTNNHRIRKIAGGIMTTVAGGGVEAFAGDGGAATKASIDSPTGLAVDTAGNLYLADTHNGRIRKVSAATGIISTIAGGAVQGFSGDGGPATAAALALPRGMTIDGAGNLFLADAANHRIRRISTSGVITTIAGQGTETFAGDNAPAVAASLDRPRSVTLSPAGLVTLADSGNQRIRQIDALPAPGPDIHTYAGLGITASGVLTLASPAVVAYGSGAIVATLGSGASASGAITFLETIGGSVLTLGTVTLGGGSATLNASNLAAGVHNISAAYLGDLTHSAAQSTVLALTVTPLALTAVANSATVVYGQSIPAFGGVLSGVLTQDAANVTVAFSTSATALSPPGVYPIVATLSGTSAGDYTLASGNSSTLTIAQAPTVTTLTVSTLATVGGSSPGATPILAVTALMQTASTTIGTPTGNITLLDGNVAVSTLPLSMLGFATVTTSALAQGSHLLTATYSGDADYLPSGSAAANVTVGTPSDFTLVATGVTSQTVLSGTSAIYNFAVQLLGTPLASAINLGVQGLPIGAMSSTNPAYLPPGGVVTTFTLTIQTPKADLIRERRPSRSPTDMTQTAMATLFLPAMMFAGRLRRRQRHFGKKSLATSATMAVLLVASGILFAILGSGCGNRVNTSADTSVTKSYTVTVTGTATGASGTAIQHSANVILQVL